MANSVELTSTGQVLVTEVAEQVIEVQAPAAPVTVEVITAGPQGPSGISATLDQIPDVDINDIQDKNVLGYRGETGTWINTDINGLVTLTDGGNF